jgi:hypothetical protein
MYVAGRKTIKLLEYSAKRPNLYCQCSFGGRQHLHPRLTVLNFEIVLGSMIKTHDGGISPLAIRVWTFLVLNEIAPCLVLGDSVGFLRSG